MAAGSKRRGWWTVVVVLVATAVVAGVAVVLFSGGGSAAATVMLEPAAQAGTDPFSASVEVGPVVEFPGYVQKITVATRKTFATDPATHLLVASGTAPGLYGGSNDKHVCRPEQLVAFLQQNPAKAAAWAGVLGISTNDIGRYVGSLTPVVLTSDTLVTNHGYRDGHATTLLSVLEAGTAVLVDATGTPRVKCNCGNPLTPPQLINPAHYRGTPWPNYNPTQVTVVHAAAPTTSFTLLNLTSGDRYSLPTSAGSPVAMTPTTTTTVAPGGPVATTPCGWFSEIDNAPDKYYGPPPATVSLPASVTVPRDAAVYAASNDAFFVAPAGFTCTARTGEDDTRAMKIIDPANTHRFITFGDGGSVQNITAGCSYLSDERIAFEAAPLPGEECPVPPAGVRSATIPTGDPQLLAAVVSVPAGVVAPWVGSQPGNAYGTQHPPADAPTLALFIANWMNATYGSSAGAIQCTLDASQAALCEADLRLVLARSKVKDQATARVALDNFLSSP